MELKDAKRLWFLFPSRSTSSPLSLQGKGEILARQAVGSEQVNGKLRIQLREETVTTAETGSC